jgi:hypothetical protein
MMTSRIWFTAAKKAELWGRWKQGQSAAAISRALERKNKTGVERVVVLHGGIGPAPRRRALAAHDELRGLRCTRIATDRVHVVGSFIESLPWPEGDLLAAPLNHTSWRLSCRCPDHSANSYITASPIDRARSTSRRCCRESRPSLAFSAHRPSECESPR